MTRVFNEVRKYDGELPPEAIAMLSMEQAYLDQVETVVSFLQGKTPEAARALLQPKMLPRGPRFRGKTRFPRSVPIQDRAKQWATFFIEDLADLVQVLVSPHFALSRYGEQIACSTASFDGMLAALEEPPTLTDEFMLESLQRHLDRVRPTFIGLTVPFPGNLYGAFRVAQAIKQKQPDLPIALGGGYANTELRRVTDPRVFEYVDFITLDDGERPILSLIEHLSGSRPLSTLRRTFYRDHDRVLFADDPSLHDFSMDDVGCPTYRGLTLDDYLTILDSTNPMHRLWSERHWNKLTVAHGCYWKQCTFCDVGLNYIGRYEKTPTDRLIGQIEQLIAETGRREFHFVDEAAPPSALKSLALSVLERGIAITWWGNIRFETAFTPDLCRLLAASGCIAVTAGLEAASDRLLEKMKKGITVDQTALIAAAFRDAGVLVHAYLMYGFPSETVQETVDALERVRQLMDADLIQSAFWHRFTTTAHSPIGLNPASHGLRIIGPEFKGFAHNDLRHQDEAGDVPEWLGEGLRRSMLNFLECRGFDLDVRDWFDHHVPKPKVAASWITRLLKHRGLTEHIDTRRRLVWIGNTPIKITQGSKASVQLPERQTPYKTTLDPEQCLWLENLMAKATPDHHASQSYPSLHSVQSDFPQGEQAFQRFLTSPLWETLRSAGLLLV
ncbi:MAG: radical SAM protein, partial [Nitrospira sp.]|nr:radical SAM protein [Nitrospira sp.]